MDFGSQNPQTTFKHRIGKLTTFWFDFRLTVDRFFAHFGSPGTSKVRVLHGRCDNFRHLVHWLWDGLLNAFRTSNRAQLGAPKQQKNNPEGIQKTLQKHPRAIPKLSKKHPKLSRKHPQNIQKTSPTHPENITNASRNHPQNEQLKYYIE